MNRLTLLALFFLCSCGSMKTIDSISESTNDNYDKVYPNLNLDLKIRYDVSNDDKILHLKLSTSDYTMASKIITTGLKVCFDVTGNKKDKVYLEYPLYHKQAFSDRIMARVRNTQRENYSLNNLIADIQNEVIFGDNGKLETFAAFPSDSSDIKVAITSRNKTEMIYDLIIPFSRLTKNGIRSLSNLSIGVVMQAPNAPNINGKLMDVSGQDAFGSGRLSSSQFDTYARSRPGVPTPSRINDFWFKVHLIGAR